MANFVSAFRALSHGTLNWDTQLDADMLDLEGRLKDAGWIISSTGITIAGNWTVSNPKYRVLGGVVALALTVTRTTSATTSSTAAGIVTGGLPVATLPAALIPSQTNGVLAAVGASSTVAAQAEVLTTGVVTVTNMAPSTSIPVGGVLDLMGTYFL